MIQEFKDSNGFLTEIIIGDVEGDNLIWVDFSETHTFLRCQQKHYYKYVRKLQKKKKSVPAKKGKVLHECLEHYYKTGSWKKPWKEYKKEYAGLFVEEQEHYGNLPQEVRRLMRGYVSYWKDKDNWKVLGTEVMFAIRVKGTRVVIRGKIDLIVEDSTGIWAVDHKSVKELPSADYRMGEAQLTLYYWVLKQFFKSKGKEVCGVIYNYIRTKAPATPRLTKKTRRLSVAKSIDTDLETVMEFIKKHDLDPADYQDYIESLKDSGRKWFVRYRVPRPKKVVKQIIEQTVLTAYAIKYAEKQGRSRCIIKQCTWDCEYISLCHGDLFGLDTEFTVKTEFEVKDPKEDVFGGKAETA